MEPGREVMRRPFVTLVSAAGFAIVYGGALWIGKSDVPTGVKSAAAVAALVSFVVFLTAEIRWIRGLDELQRLVQLEALAIAFPMSLALVMFLGLIQRFAVLPVDDLSYRHIWPLMVLFYVIGAAIAMRRYQ